MKIWQINEINDMHLHYNCILIICISYGTMIQLTSYYTTFRSILLVHTHDFIIIQVYGPTGGDG